MANVSESKDFVKNVFQGSPGIWCVVGVLLLISSVSVFSSLQTIKGYNYFGQYMNHIGYMCLSILVMVGCHKFRPKPLMSLLILSFVAFFALVLLCPIFGTEINGAKRTIFGFQPSDCIKPCLIVFTAFCLAGGMRSKSEGKGWSWEKGNIFKWTPPKWFWISVCLVICLFVGVENGSQAVLLALILLFMSIMAGVPFKQIGLFFGALALPIVLTGAIFVAQLDENGESTWAVFQKDGMLHRVPTWYSRVMNVGNSQPLDENFDFYKDEQANHGKVAVANSKGVGCGVLGSSERSVLVLAFSDYIFASIVEMSGFFGVAVIYLLYGSFMFITVRWGLKSKSPVYSLILFGAGAMITFQALTNMLVGSGAFVTGQPLPFVSKGGQSMLICAVVVALVQSIIKAEMTASEKVKAKVKAEKNEEE